MILINASILTNNILKYILHEYFFYHKWMLVRCRNGHPVSFRGLLYFVFTQYFNISCYYNHSRQEMKGNSSWIRWHQFIFICCKCMSVKICCLMFHNVAGSWIQPSMFRLTDTECNALLIFKRFTTLLAIECSPVHRGWWVIFFHMI